MSFLQKINVPLITTKLTAIGRQKLAAGQLNFKYYAFGDSQMDYRSTLSQENLKPKDKEPNIKTFLTKSDCNPYQLIDGVKVQECCIHNPSTERGFFTNNLQSLKLNNSYFKGNGTVLAQQVNGSNILDLGAVKFDDSDILMLKLDNNTTGYLAPSEAIAPVPYLFYKITKNSTSTVAELDRNLPYITGSGSTEPINFYVFSPNVSYYTISNQNTLWDYDNLTFKTNCLVEDTLVWNLNIVWNEDLIGTQTSEQHFKDFCSYNYAGEKEYLGYNIDCPDIITPTNCDDKLLGVDDDVVKAIGILHYTNTNKQNSYAEYIFIDESTPFHLYTQDIMYHRYKANTAHGTTIGMGFTNGNTKKFIQNTNIEYYDLLEDTAYLATGQTSISVGKIFPQLQIITIHDEELLAALSYKSNRNFTLPKLKGKMVNSNAGILPKGKTLYMTYTMESDDTIQYILPQQRYLKFINNTNSDKDVEFYLESLNELPYMRQREALGYDGFGFSFHRFKLLIQVVDTNSRPQSDKWLQINFTNNYLTNFNGNTINPLRLESQIPQSTGFTLNATKLALGSIFDLNILQIPDVTCPTKMGFGCEQIFFGNIQMEIGVCVYKSIMEFVLDSSTFIKTTNPTWDTNQPLLLSEIGIYDDKYNLVQYSAFYKQIDIMPQSISLIETQIDF